MYMRKRFKKLRVDMKDMSKEQHNVKQMQSQVEARLRAVQEECDRLRDETDQIIRQSADTQARLALMFDILKARERGDFDKAAQLTRSLRPGTRACSASGWCWEATIACSRIPNQSNPSHLRSYGRPSLALISSSSVFTLLNYFVWLPIKQVLGSNREGNEGKP
ncbi:hypothetical protein V6N13_121465 [Hibiscus sabdariffa]|uniref:Uncharacterized protein n=1 Tax=Hibiscus sabdariffa TaxID=183260 RepID=A0ABR2PDL0_9ROSI